MKDALESLAKADVQVKAAHATLDPSTDPARHLRCARLYIEWAKDCINAAMAESAIERGPLDQK